MQFKGTCPLLQVVIDWRDCGMCRCTDNCSTSFGFALYRILSSKRPPPFDDPMHGSRIYALYVYKWLLCVSAHPRFFAHQFHGHLLERIQYMYILEVVA